MSKANTRIYRVRDTSKLDAHPVRLVEARDVAQVRSHLQAPFEIDVPTTIEALDLTQNKGIKVERAGAKEDAEQAAIRG